VAAVSWGQLTLSTPLVNVMARDKGYVVVAAPIVVVVAKVEQLQ
jgi:hypothetical protein